MSFFLSLHFSCLSLEGSEAHLPIAVSTGLDELYAEKRELVSQHKKAVVEFEQVKELRNREVMKRKEEEQRDLHSAKIKELFVCSTFLFVIL